MKNELRKILCTVPEIEKDLMELKFGAKVSCNNKYGTLISFNIKDDWYNALDKDHMIGDLEFHKNKLSDLVNHGNPLEDHHLRMYCDKKGITSTIYESGTIDFNDVCGKDNNLLITLDNTKSLNDQSNETYGKIVKFLKDNK